MISWLILLLVLLPSVAAATALSSAAATMSPGTWLEITSSVSGNGFNNGAILQPPGCPAGNRNTDITQYHNKAVWNPIAKRFQMVGASHSSCGNGVRAIYYDDATNTWGDLPMPNVRPDPSHRYDMNAMDPATGRHYTTDYDSFTSYYLDNGAGAWVPITRPQTNRQCCTADAFFPTYQGGKRFFHWDGDWGLWSYNPATGRWQQHYQGNGSEGFGRQLTGQSTSVYNHYSALCDCLVFGGGGGLYKLSNKGVASSLSLTNGPVNFHVDGSGEGTSLVVDPIGGFLLSIDTTGTMKQFDPRDKGSWTNLSVTVPSYILNTFDPAAHLVSAPISDYGVVMYIKSNGSPGTAGSVRVFLYRHSAPALRDDSATDRR